MKKSSRRNQSFSESIGAALPRQRDLAASQAAEIEGWKVLSLMLTVAIATLMLVSWRPLVRETTDSSPVGASVVLQGASVSDSQLQVTAPAHHWQQTDSASSLQDTQSSSQVTEDSGSFQATQSGYSLQGSTIQ